MAGGCLGDRHASRFCDRLSGLHQLRQLAKVNVLHDRQRRRDRQAGCRPWSWWQHTLASLEVCLIAHGPSQPFGHRLTLLRSAGRPVFGFRPTRS